MIISQELHLVVTRCFTITVTLELLHCYNKKILLQRERLAFSLLDDDEIGNLEQRFQLSYVVYID